jgi:hypothetical protein
MAKTVTAGQLVTLVSNKFPRLLIESFAARYADEVLTYMWKRYPWKESIKELPQFSLTLEDGDYGPPSAVVPGDFLGFHEQWIRMFDGRSFPLQPKPDLPLSFSPGLPTAISYITEKQAFRLHPRPSYTSPDAWVEGRYKKQVTKITNENLSSYTLPWDDQYAIVFRKGLVWQFKMDSQDETQAFMVFRQLLDEMAGSEGLLAGTPQISPTDSLELGGW